MVYDYHPGSQTLLSKYFTSVPETNGYTDPFAGEARPFRYGLVVILIRFSECKQLKISIFVSLFAATKVLYIVQPPRHSCQRMKYGQLSYS